MLRGLEAHRSWGTLEALLGHSWALLGASWGLLGRYEGNACILMIFDVDLGFILGPLWSFLGAS